MPTREDRVASLTDAFLRKLDGRPVVKLKEAASQLLGCSETLLRNAIYRGELAAFRSGQNSKMFIRCEALARWFIDAEEKNSLPVAKNRHRDDLAATRPQRLSSN